VYLDISPLFLQALLFSLLASAFLFYVIPVHLSLWAELVFNGRRFCVLDAVQSLPIRRLVSYSTSSSPFPFSAFIYNTAVRSEVLDYVL